MNLKKMTGWACIGLIALAACSKQSDLQPDDDDVPDVVRTPLPFDQLPERSKTLEVGPTESYVNVMGTQRTRLPDFRKLSAKPGILRGYVKDVFGRPVSEAEIGVRSSWVGGAYTTAVGRSDAAGYYEIAVPTGTADLFKAVGTIDYHTGRAPVSLFPADSSLNHFQSTDGAVEDFVLVPYGQRHRDAVAEQPWLSFNYLGGSIHLSYTIRTQSLPLPGSIPLGAEIIVTLVPEALFHADEKISFTVRKVVENTGFYILNIPVGTYRVRVQLADGTDLDLEESVNLKPAFGMHPKKATGQTQVTFIPGPSSVMPWYGNWETVPINVRIPE
ncbi:MAG: carboxypeptidase regulatory-like domain-containing protein [Parapedobacter sp.]|nr:MAG: carboxypeptidase regulatory-like domain-containing protein [Parapedobacter sp.]